jgi:hypothetical protein
MDYTSDDAIMTDSFPFTDLHSFKDFVVFVQTYLPDRFRPREAVGPELQWTVDLAFTGLRLGLRMSIKEKGERDEFARGMLLVEEAYDAYRHGREHEGYFKLENLSEVLSKIPAG